MKVDIDLFISSPLAVPVDMKFLYILITDNNCL